MFRVFAVLATGVATVLITTPSAHAAVDRVRYEVTSNGPVASSRVVYGPGPDVRSGVS